MDECGIAGVMQGITRRGADTRFAAFAVTARSSVAKLGTFPKSDFGVGRLLAATGPGIALLVDMGGAEVSTFGGLASLAAAMRQATAVIIDGACRDLDEVRRSGLWLASRHVTPTTGKMRVRLEAMGVPVVIGGITVRQDDLIVGDDTGIIAVPRTELDRVLAVAERMLAMDAQMEHAIKNGATFAEAAAAAQYI